MRWRKHITFDRIWKVLLIILLTLLLLKQETVIYDKPAEPKPHSLTLVEPLPAPSYTELQPVPNVVKKPVKRAVNSSNGYIYHQCTWHVKNKRPDIPNTWGNATNWYANAQRSGYSVGSVPKAGAIGWVYGHVVYVEAVKGNMVYISERNYDYRGSYRERWVTASSYRYIY